MGTNQIARCDEPITVTIQQTQRLSGLSNSRIYELINEGQLRATKVGGRRLVFFDSLKELLRVSVAAE